MSDDYALEDIWINAFAALTQSPSDPKPLAKLLRSDTPMPPGARDTLAELLSPGNPEYLMCRLVLESTDRSYALSTADRAGKIASALQISAEHAAKVTELKAKSPHGSKRVSPSDDAADLVGKKYGPSGRQIHRIRAELKKTHERITSRNPDKK